MVLVFLWEEGSDCVLWDSRFGRSVFLVVWDSEGAQHAATRTVKAKDTTATSLLTIRDSHRFILNHEALLADLLSLSQALGLDGNRPCTEKLLRLQD